MSENIQIDHSETPIRLFKSDFLEFFTHVHPVTVIVIWVPFALYMFYQGIMVRPEGGGLAYLPVCFLVGLFLWTFVEYNIHRFFFHYCPRTPWQERIVFLFHGIHHLQPRMKTRLVMPPAASIPLAAFFLLLFNLLFGKVLGQPHWTGPFICGFTLGYLTYDLTHYATHHFPMWRGRHFLARYYNFLKRHHMAHHYKTPDKRFGVSSPLWDWVYKTIPEE